jgi:hypothetical protein
MSLPILVKALAIADQRFIFLPFLNSNALPIAAIFFNGAKIVLFCSFYNPCYFL